MIVTTQDRTLALAGVAQAAELVGQVARSGQCSHQAAEASLASIFVTDPDDVASTFGSMQGLRLGLRSLVEVLGANAASEHLQTLQMTLSIVKLGKKLKKDQPRLQRLSDAIALTQSAWDSRRDALDASAMAQLADAYEHHISTLPFRIRVQGNPEMLKNESKVQLIRALLLAGLRSAILWQQVGGNQWRLIFERKTLVANAQRLV